MTREQVMKEPIWMSRLIFKASIHFGKQYKNLTEDEEYELRLIILKERAEREAKEQLLRDHYKKHGYGGF
jgi:hypothetical protein